MQRAFARLGGALALFVAVVSPAHGQAGDYTINATDPWAIFDVALTPGQWSFGVTAGGWNAWGGSVYGCDASGMDCTNGWLNGFLWSLNGGPEQGVGYPDLVPPREVYQTAAIALANAPGPLFLNVSTASTLRLRIGDDPYYDNLGSLTVSVAQASTVPEPMSMALLGTGLAGLGAMRRRRRKQDGATA